MTLPPRRVRLTRDGILLLAGLIGVAYEAYTGLERITLLLLYAGMMGLPSFIQSDEKRNKKNGDGSNGS